jgi:hypothetical protein
MRSAILLTIVLLCGFFYVVGCGVNRTSGLNKRSFTSSVSSTPQKDQECSYSAAKSITVKGKTFRLIGTYLPAEITAEHTKNFNKGFYRKPFNSCDRGDVIAEYIETTKK